MINEAPGSINFTMFLTLMGEKLSGTDPENEILAAFEPFDTSKSGFVNADQLREFLTTMGDRFTDEEVFHNNFYLFVIVSKKVKLSDYGKKKDLKLIKLGLLL